MHKNLPAEGNRPNQDEAFRRLVVDLAPALPATAWVAVLRTYGMRILLMTRADFGEFEWVPEYIRSLERLGHEAVKFDPLLSKVRDFDLIHFFSADEANSWHMIKQNYPGAKLIVTPSWGPFLPESKRGRHRRLLKGGYRILRALIQRRWPPQDEVSWRNAPDQFVVASREWEEFIKREWKIPAWKIKRTETTPVSLDELAAWVTHSPG